MENRTTIKDVAREAGVSISTVSRVLNNSAPVGDDIKKRVNDAMKKTGYIPNAIARSLKSNESNIIAYIVSNTADPFFTAISRNIEEVMYENGVSLINGSTGFSAEREQKILSNLYEMRVKGIIINTVGNNDEFIADMSQHIPIVLSNRNVNSLKFKGDFVDFDNVGGIKKLVDHLVKLGHKNIGFINGPTHLSTAKERQIGFITAMRNKGIDIDEDSPLIANSKELFLMEDGYTMTEKMLTIDQIPTAIIAANSEMTLGALKYCNEYGIRVPEDLSLCCFGDIRNNELMKVDITYVHTDFMAIGTRMGEMMLERSSLGPDEYVANREVRFDTPLVIRNSTARLK